jgi:hypothetical protein
MKIKTLIWIIAATIVSFSPSCSKNPINSTSGTRPQPGASENREPGPLSNTAFKAELALVEPPAKLRSGQKEIVRVKIKNASGEQWWSRGGPVNNRADNKFYLAAGNRWLKPDGSLLTNMDGRYGIGKDLKPGEETEVPLQITAPKDPGEYTLEVDLVQEAVAWFSDKGSHTARARVIVVR